MALECATDAYLSTKRKENKTKQQNKIERQRSVSI